MQMPVLNDDDPEAWRLSAACRGADVLLFFDDRPKKHPGAAYRDARVHCARCDVIADCTEFIMTTERGAYRVGYVAGMTPGERHELARSRGKATA